MNVLPVIFILLNVGAVAAPLAGVAVMHMDNPLEMVIPTEMQQILTSTLSTQDTIELPQIVDSDYDLATRTVTATFSFKNPFQIDLTVNALSAQVQCTTHNFNLGNAQLKNPVQINQDTTGLITVVFLWTQTAEDHFQTAHPQATTIDITLTNLLVDVSGITIQTPESIQVNVPLPE